MLLPGGRHSYLAHQIAVQLPLTFHDLREALQQLRQLTHTAHQLLVLVELLTEVVVDLLKLIDQAIAEGRRAAYAVQPEER